MPAYSTCWIRFVWEIRAPGNAAAAGAQAATAKRSESTARRSTCRLASQARALGSSEDRATFQRKPGLAPVVLALGVLAHVRVAERDQAPSGDLGVLALRVRAVGHDRRILVGQQRRSERVDLGVGDVDRAGEMRGVVVPRAERIDYGHGAERGDQLVAGDLGSHQRAPHGKWE